MKGAVEKLHREVGGYRFMAHHKRRRPKNRRAGCLFCKPFKANGCQRPAHTDLRRAGEAKHRGHGQQY